MLAAQFTGREKFGLAALLEEHFGLRLDKKHQRADWSVRPLEPELLAYAALDTAHLFALKGRLEEELSDQGRLAWVEEEFRLLETVAPGPPKKPWCLDLKGSHRLSPRQLALLQGLLELRDGLARELDRPPFKVFSNQILLAWAQAPPAGRKEVLETPGAGRSLLARAAQGVLEAILRARLLPEGECPRPIRKTEIALNDQQAQRLRRLKKVRDHVASGLRLSPGLIVNAATLEGLCREDPLVAAATLRGALKGWQMQVIGEELRTALRAADKPVGR